MPISLTFVRKRVLIALMAAFAGAVLTSCASAPMQEMSDARQAIRAAQDAGAANTAAKPLSEAQIALNRAESQLDKRFFRAARRSAEEAHGKAVEALQLARETK
jgi:basic membrane lipoprotein Med (substrate-binding protein (PBP1-ABC) superfamily)